MSIFPYISRIDDLRPHVSGKKEIGFYPDDHGVTSVVYSIADKNTFDNPYALECRGIMFDSAGNIVSRPLHKFFNIGERPETDLRRILARPDLVGVYDKIDGSMIATAWVDGRLLLRSKSTFGSLVCRLATEWLNQAENSSVLKFCNLVASTGQTAIFEFQHPETKVVVDVREPSMKLLHVRDNISGEYIGVEIGNPIHDEIAQYRVPQVKRYPPEKVRYLLDSLVGAEQIEGLVLQFEDGTLIKVKCDWYTRIHKVLSHVRVRDIARLVIHEELDDVKAILIDAGVAEFELDNIQSTLVNDILEIQKDIETTVNECRHMSPGDFFKAKGNHPWFRQMSSMARGKQFDMKAIKEHYEQKYLKERFDLRPLLDKDLDS